MLRTLLPLLLACIALSAAPTKQERMLSELDTFTNFFDVTYGLKEYKSNLYKWDLEKEHAKARSKILAKKKMATKEFHQVLLNFCRSTKDYHVTLSFCGTENSLLPIAVRGAQGRYFIMDDTGRKAVSEIISFGGKPINEVIDNLAKHHCSNNNLATDRRLAASMLTYRHAEFGLPAPKGKVTIATKTGDSKKNQVYRWDYESELICHSAIPISKKTPSVSKPQWTTPLHGLLGKGSPFAAPDGHILPLGEPIWTAPGGMNNPFSGKIYQLETGKKVGYLRIPHYMGGKNEANLFRQTIGYMEQATDLLVIDQNGNPGGNPLYMMGLISSLVTEPTPNILEKLTLNQNEVLEALFQVQMLSDKNAILYVKNDSYGYPVTQAVVNQLKSYNLHIINAWEKNKIVTDFVPLFGISHILPHPQVTYSKPIILTVDELCFSCGDILPAILQDSGRATLFGTRTAGAGGSIIPFTYPNHFGVYQATITRSIAIRPNGQDLENVGVIPDIIYEVTAEDLQNGYDGYREALLHVIHETLE